MYKRKGWCSRRAMSYARIGTRERGAARASIGRPVNLTGTPLGTVIAYETDHLETALSCIFNRIDRIDERLLANRHFQNNVRNIMNELQKVGASKLTDDANKDSIKKGIQTIINKLKSEDNLTVERVQSYVNAARTIVKNFKPVYASAGLLMSYTAENLILFRRQCNEQYIGCDLCNGSIDVK